MNIIDFEFKTSEKAIKKFIIIINYYFKLVNWNDYLLMEIMEVIMDDEY
jgi:hypothetical protein